MKTKININFKRGIRAAGVIALALAAFLPVGNSFAYGPERPTFTLDNPADHPQFNSITNNPYLGDERNFVRISETNEDGKLVLTDEMNVVPGKKYTVFLYYHNNAASNLNSQGKGMAMNTRMYSQYPSVVSPGKKHKVYGEISAANSTPKAVWDEAYFTTDSKASVTMRYVINSAKVHSNGNANGQLLTDSGEASLFSKPGAPMGYFGLDGNVPGCYEYSGFITYELYAEQVGATINKYVSTDGVNYVNEVTAKPGDKLYYKVIFENTGTSDLTNVGFHDQLPKGVTLVPGTTKLFNGTYPDGLLMKDVIGKNGMMTGMYTPKGKAEITYQVTVNKDILNGQECGKTYQYINQMYANHDKGELHDGAIINVPFVCPEKPDVPVDPTPVEPEPTPEPEPDLPSELPKTGPVEIVLAILAIVCVGTGFAYWWHSQREVAKAKKMVGGDLGRIKEESYADQIEKDEANVEAVMSGETDEPVSGKKTSKAKNRKKKS